MGEDFDPLSMTPAQASDLVLMMFPCTPQKLWAGLAMSRLIREGFVDYSRAWFVGPERLRLTIKGRWRRFKLLSGIKRTAR